MKTNDHADHPGPEWIAQGNGCYLHPGLGIAIAPHKQGIGVNLYRWDDTGISGWTPTEACRAISAAALAWEQQRGYAAEHGRYAFQHGKPRPAYPSYDSLEPLINPFNNE